MWKTLIRDEQREAIYMSLEFVADIGSRHATLVANWAITLGTT